MLHFSKRVDHHLRSHFVKKYILSLLLILSLLPQFGLSQGGRTVAQKPPVTNTPPKQAYEIPISTKTLANGLEVIVMPDSSVPLVTIELAVRNGSFTEPPELNGLSHLYEHMFFKTNRALSISRCENLQIHDPQSFRNYNCDNKLKFKSEIKDVSYMSQVDQIGIVKNGETREEVVEYYFTTTSPNLQTAMKFIKDAIRYPEFDENEFSQEKQVVIGEIDRNLSNPYYYLTREMSDRMFSKYPTRKMPLGTRATVAAATTDQMRTIQSRYYVPNNSALVVSGDVNPEMIFILADQLFGDWKQREVDPFKEFPLVDHPQLARSQGVIVNQPIQNVVIEIGWQGPSIGKDDAATYAADVFSYILNQPDSRFQRKLVDSGLASGVGFNYYTQKNVGPISLLLQTTPENAKAAVAAAYTEIAHFSDPGYFTDEELESSKTLLDSNDLFDREKPSEYVHTIGFWWSTTGIDYFRGYHRNLRATTRADLSRYIKTYILGKPHLGIALISSENQAVSKLSENDLIGGNQ